MTATDQPTPATPVFANRTLREQVYEHLREEILRDRLTPGTELHEVGLAQSLGVSRGPLREALGLLAAEGLVTIVPRRGAVVTQLTKHEFIEAWQVRAALESLAARLAVPLLREAERRGLHALSDEMRLLAEEGDVPRFLDVNRRFHQRFVEASGNRRLQGIHTQLITQTGRLLTRSRRLRGELGASVAEHEAILAAVDAGDAERTAHLLEAHVVVPRPLLDGAGDELFRLAG